MTQTASGSDKRNFFRVKQDILLEYQAVDAHTAKESDPQSCFTGSASLELFADYRRIDQEAAPLIQAISSQSRELAEYLLLMNRKFDLLAQQLTSTSSDKQEVQSAQVSLSEGGIAFNSQKSFYKGSHLALRATFMPSYTGVSVFAEVIRCEPTKDGAFQVAAKFYRVNSAKREVIGREIMRAQQRLARAKKHTKNSQNH
jgi:hypothetical protein